MQRIFSALLLGCALLGCTDGGTPPAAATGPLAQVHVRFGGLVDTIEIAAVERLPLRAAELIAPDGTATPASNITVDPAPRLASGQWAASSPWQGPLGGNQAVAALTQGNAGAGAALQSEQRLLAIASRADIPLADPVAYRRDWQRYSVKLTFGTPPAVETREIPAPQPPPR